MNQFYTRDKANEGIKLPLYTPEGEETDQWLTILGVDSDEYQRQMAITHRALLNLKADVKALPEDKREDFMLDHQVESERKILASLIKDWSFEQECTMENKLEFLKNAPQIADHINQIAGNRRNFFKFGQAS